MEMKKKETIITWGEISLDLLIFDLIDKFSVKNQKFLYYGTFLILFLILKIIENKGLITKNWWKKFIPFYILYLVLRNLDFINKITLYYGTLGILSIIFILLLIKLFLRKNKNT